MRLLATVGLLMFGACLAAQPAPAPVQITHGNNSDPSMAPDGKRMVVISEATGREQLQIMNVDGSHVVQLTTEPFNHEDPAWSPDGRHIAYVSLQNGGEVIHMMDVDGSHDVALTPATQKTIHPSWSRDSRHILYCTDDDLKPPKKNTSELYSIDVASKQTKMLISGGTNTYGSWSPNEKHLVFRKMLGESNSEVFVANSDGSDEKNLTNNPAFDGWPAWSPDGRRIAFASNRNEENHQIYNIYVMNADGTSPQMIAATAGRGTAPKWSIDGKKIYFPICRGRELGCEIYVSDVPSETAPQN